MGLRGPLGKTPKRKKGKKERGGPAGLAWPNGAQPGPAHPHGRPSHVGIVPHGLASGVGSPPPLNRGPPLPLEIHPISFFFSPTMSMVLFLELRTRREVSPLYAHRRATRSNLPLPLLCWIWSPEVVIYTVRVWNYEVLHGWHWKLSSSSIRP